MTAGLALSILLGFGVMEAEMGIASLSQRHEFACSDSRSYYKNLLYRNHSIDLSLHELPRDEHKESCGS